MSTETLEEREIAAPEYALEEDRAHAEDKMEKLFRGHDLDKLLQIEKRKLTEFLGVYLMENFEASLTLVSPEVVYIVREIPDGKTRLEVLEQAVKSLSEQTDRHLGYSLLFHMEQYRQAKAAKEALKSRANLREGTLEQAQKAIDEAALKIGEFGALTLIEKALPEKEIDGIKQALWQKGDGSKFHEGAALGYAAETPNIYPYSRECAYHERIAADLAYQQDPSLANAMKLVRAVIHAWGAGDSDPFGGFTEENAGKIIDYLAQLPSGRPPLEEGSVCRGVLLAQMPSGYAPSEESVCRAVLLSKPGLIKNVAEELWLEGDPNHEPYIKVAKVSSAEDPRYDWARSIYRAAQGALKGSHLELRYRFCEEYLEHQLDPHNFAKADRALWAAFRARRGGALGFRSKKFVDNMMENMKKAHPEWNFHRTLLDGFLGVTKDRSIAVYGLHQSQFPQDRAKSLLSAKLSMAGIPAGADDRPLEMLFYLLTGRRVDMCKMPGPLPLKAALEP